MSNWNKYKNLMQIKLNIIKIKLNKYATFINEIKMTLILFILIHVTLIILSLILINRVESGSNLFYLLYNYIYIYLRLKLFLIKFINNYFHCFYLLGEWLKYLYIQYLHMFYLLGELLKYLYLKYLSIFYWLKKFFEYLKYLYMLYLYMFYLLGLFLDEKGREVDMILNELTYGTDFHIFMYYYTQLTYYLIKIIIDYLNILPYAVKVSIINIILIILFILIGGVIPLLERKYLSLIQRRIGPKYVGYNGRLQFIADAMKLLLKEIIYLHNINKLILTILPIYTLSINLFILLNIIFLNNIKLFDINVFILILLLIELITTIVLTYIGFLVKNKYTIIASTRLLSGVIVFEIFITVVYLYFYLFFNKLSLNNITNNTIINKFLIFSINLPIFFNFILINLKRVPYDIIEAETELIMGYSTEHSGFLSGALLLIEYTHIFLWSYIIIIFIL